MLPPLVVICGPTASGKSRFSLELASAISGAEIISADSRQVYRGMDIGTAKVSVADRGRIPHHGLDLVDPDEPFSAAMFHSHAFEALGAIVARRGVALLVGGTGLYLRAVARDIPLNDTGHDPQVRAALETRLEREGLDPLVAQLRESDPAASATIDIANPRRVIRALERATVLGDAMPPQPRGYAGPVLWLGTDLPRPDHDRAIRERSAWQFEHGLVEEAQWLLERYPEDLRSFSAVGYREAFDVLAGRRSREDAVARVALRTRQYARRQRTWFRAEPELEWLELGAVDLPRLIGRIEAMRASVAAT